MNGTQTNHWFRGSLVNCGINGSCYFLYEYVTGVSNFHFFKMKKFGNQGNQNRESTNCMNQQFQENRSKYTASLKLWKVPLTVRVNSTSIG